VVFARASRERHVTIADRPRRRQPKHVERPAHVSRRSCCLDLSGYPSGRRYNLTTLRATGSGGLIDAEWEVIPSTRGHLAGALPLPVAPEEAFLASKIRSFLGRF